MAAEDFCLKWNDHHSVFFSVAQELLQQGTLADVTLATGKSSFPAHRLVLSVCSSFFRSLFSKRDLSAQGFFVYLKDVSEDHLAMLISFMYKGEINCAESELLRFLATARGLGIKGLSEVEEEYQTCYENPPSSVSLQSPPPPPKKKAKVSNKRKREEFILGGQEPTHQQNKRQIQVPKEALSPEVVVPKIEEAVKGVENDADYQGKLEKGQLGTEIAGAHNSHEETLECPYCPKVFASGFGLKRHAATHEKKRFKCDICEKLLSRKDNLLAHQRNVHGHVFESGTHEPKDTTAEHHDALEPDDESHLLDE